MADGVIKLARLVCISKEVKKVFDSVNIFHQSQSKILLV